MSVENLKYPIGKWNSSKIYVASTFQNDLDEISKLPGLLAEKVKNLSVPILHKTYRENGWTIAQIVHHLSDSHMNAYIRHKLTITEDNPTIKPYTEALWAKLPDACETNLSNSLILLEALHKRWVQFLQTVPIHDLDRTFFHPESQKKYSLAESISLYAWHGKHHLAHINLAIQN